MINNNNLLAVIILAAGKGKRMNSDLPKVLHLVGGIPMITRVVHTAKNLGADKIIAVVGHQYKLIQAALENEVVEFVLQLQQLGTAHAVLQCQDLLQDFKGNILILYGDVPLTRIDTLQNLLNIHQNQSAEAAILTTDLPDPYGYGRIIRNPDNSLKKIVEENDAAEEERAISEINSGIYVFNATTLFQLLPRVGNNNSQNEYYLPDVLNLIIGKKGKVAIEKTKNYYEIQGVNNNEQLTEVNQINEKV